MSVRYVVIVDSSDYMFVRIIERSAPNINPNVNYELELWRLVVTGRIALVQNVDIYICCLHVR